MLIFEEGWGGRVAVWMKVVVNYSSGVKARNVWEQWFSTRFIWKNKVPELTHSLRRLSSSSWPRERSNSSLDVSSSSLSRFIFFLRVSKMVELADDGLASAPFKLAFALPMLRPTPRAVCNEDIVRLAQKTCVWLWLLFVVKIETSGIISLPTNNNNNKNKNNYTNKNNNNRM